MRLFILVVICAVISAVFCGIQWLLSLTGICGTPTWEKFIWGGVFLLAVGIIFFLVRAAKDVSKYKNDLTFRLMSDYYGVTAKEYERVYKILQDFAQFYRNDFMLFIDHEEGWSVHTALEMEGKLKGTDKYRYIPIFTNPGIGIPDFYIKFDELIDDKTAIQFLIENYKQELKKRGKL